MDGCAMGGPLSVTFSDIYMVKIKNDDVTPSKPIFYHIFVDDNQEIRRQSFVWPIKQLSSKH